MWIRINIILSVIVYALIGDGPTGSYCGEPDTPLGKASIKITVTSPSTFSIEASWTPKGGDTKSGSETDIEYEYNAAEKEVTVKSLDKLTDLIKQMEAPLSADMLAHLGFKDNTLYVTKLGNYPLEAC